MSPIELEEVVLVLVPERGRDLLEPVDVGVDLADVGPAVDDVGCAEGGEAVERRQLHRHSAVGDDVAHAAPPQLLPGRLHLLTEVEAVH